MRDAQRETRPHPHPSFRCGVYGQVRGLHLPGSNARLYHVETRSFLKDVENVLARYNYDKGGSHVNFWGDVQFDTKYEKKCINKVLNHTQQNTVETPLGIASVVVPSG